MTPPRPIPDSYWVVPGVLLAGEYPGARDREVARRKVRRLLGAGITLFVDLTEAGEWGLAPYLPIAQEEAALLGRTISHMRLSIPDMSVPTREGMRAILAAIDDGMAAGEVVYLHCWGGIGRTGTAVGCYLVQRGLASDDALQEVARLRVGIPDSVRPSPETEAQRQFVRLWGKIDP